MSNCQFCGQPVGFLHWSHPECRQKHNEGEREILSLLKVRESSPDAKFLNRIKQVQGRAFINDEELRKWVAQAWIAAVEKASEEELLDEQVQVHLAEWRKHFSLSQEELDENSAFTQLGKAIVIRELLSGVVNPHVVLEGNLRLNLQ